MQLNNVKQILTLIRITNDALAKNKQLAKKQEKLWFESKKSAKLLCNLNLLIRQEILDNEAKERRL